MHKNSHKKHKQTSRHIRNKNAHRGVAEQRGRLAEWFAAGFLMLKGYRIMGLRARTPLGEIDLIALRVNTLCFIEVKLRSSLRNALEAPTPAQCERIARAAEFWCASRPWALKRNWRYDFFALSTRGEFRHVRDAFRPKASGDRISGGFC